MVTMNLNHCPIYSKCRDNREIIHLDYSNRKYTEKLKITISIAYMTARKEKKHKINKQRGIREDLYLCEVEHLWFTSRRVEQ